MTRRAVIIGMGGGIGAATAEAFRSADWSVAGIDLVESSDEDVLPLDIGRDDAEGELRRFFDSLDRVDALVNAAGIQNTTTALETSDEEWQRIMDVNLRGTFWATRAAHPHLTSTGGAVVNVSSVHAVATTSGAGAYAASKGALVALTRSLALEWAPGVRVNCVLPGAIDTPMLAEGIRRAGQGDAEGRNALRRSIPLKRVGQPSDVAEAVLFLADGRRSAFVTGQTLVVDGGVLAALGTA